MRRFTMISLLVFCTLPLTAVSPRLSARQIQDPTPSEGEWKWLDKHYWKILDLSLPLEKRPGVVISYRQFESLLQLGSPELGFCISRPVGPPKTNLTVHLRVPDGHSLVWQLLEEHRASPKSSVKEIKARVKFKDWNISESQCPQLRDLVQNLPAVKLGFRTDIVILDPTIQEFYLDSDDGTVTAEITDSENALSKWAGSAITVIQACADRI